MPTLSKPPTNCLGGLGKVSSNGACSPRRRLADRRVQSQKTTQTDTQHRHIDIIDTHTPNKNIKNKVYV